MDLYYEKYLKYKEKYLNLKNSLLQKGGENNFSLLSFNILFPHEKVSLITFKTIFNTIFKLIEEENREENRELIKKLKNTSGKFPDTIYEIIALADKKRYEEKRIYYILDILDNYVGDSVIFLQEVNIFTLNMLKEKYKSTSYILYNKEEDVLILKGNDYSREEYRVIIIPIGHYTLIKTYDLPLFLENENAIIKKNGVFASIQDNINKKIYKLINVHFHYTFTPKIINTFIPIIKKIIEYNEDNEDNKDIVVFGGDTNKSLTELTELTDLMSGFNFSTTQNESMPTFIKTDTLSSSPDHILTSNLPGKISIITENDRKQILYDINIINDDIIRCLLKYKDLIVQSSLKISIFNINSERANLLIDELCSILSVNENYISDHNPILFESIQN